MTYSRPKYVQYVCYEDSKVMYIETGPYSAPRVSYFRQHYTWVTVECSDWPKVKAFRGLPKIEQVPERKSRYLWREARGMLVRSDEEK